MIKGYYLPVLVFLFLITIGLASTAMGSASSPYSSDFDLRNMVGFSDNTINAENIVAFIQEKYPSSPMLSEEDIGNCFISAGQSNNVNPAFLIATACLEGGFGTAGWAISHPECHNTFGYGIPSGTTQPDDLNCMDSWCAMIQRVASVIAHGHNYYTQGLYTVSQVRAKYAASPNADSIANLMNELYTFSISHKETLGPNEPERPQEQSIVGITGFKWIGMDADKIGEYDFGMPDGSMDGHFLLDLNLPAPTEIKSIQIYSADANGNPVGGQFWHTAVTNYWMLGVFDKGTQLNMNHVQSLGYFSGHVQFDLYADDSGWFKPGNRFGLEVSLGNLQKLITIPLA
jgi:hypothetical protein